MWWSQLIHQLCNVNSLQSSGKSIFTPFLPVNVGTTGVLSASLHLLSWSCLSPSLHELFSQLCANFLCFLLLDPAVVHCHWFALNSSISTVSSSDYSSSLEAEVKLESASVVTNATGSSELTRLSPENAVFPKEYLCQICQTYHAIIELSNVWLFSANVQSKILHSNYQKQEQNPSMNYQNRQKKLIKLGHIYIYIFIADMQIAYASLVT